MKNLNLVVPCCPGLQVPGPTLALKVPGSQASRMPIVKGSDCAGAEAESATKQASSKAATQSRVIDDPPFGSELADRRKRRPVRLSGISLAPKRLVSRQIAGLHTLKPRQTAPLWLRASQRVRQRWHNRHPCPVRPHSAFLGFVRRSKCYWRSGAERISVDASLRIYFVEIRNRSSDRLHSDGSDPAYGV